MVSQERSRRTLGFLAVLVIVVGLIPSPASAQYQVTNLVSNQKGKAKHQDTDLVNAWGISFFPGNPFWVSDAGTGKSTLYDNKGVKQGLVVTVPPASGTGSGMPTGMVANGTSDFVVSGSPALFIFATLDGTISGWNSATGSSAVIVATAPNGTNYTGLAIGQSKGKNFLYAADFAHNKVDIYDGTFKLVSSFTDTTLQQKSAYNVQNINGKLFVTFSQGFAGQGAVDIFNTAGKLIKRLTKSTQLQGPWGLALAPKNFGPASQALLVGNLGNGRINAFNATTGKFMGPLKTPANKIIKIDELWGLTFGGGGVSGNTNQLFFTAGPNQYANGLFGVIDFK
jgi:uncharacterized protein (TIGR03118 family)